MSATDTLEQGMSPDEYQAPAPRPPIRRRGKSRLPQVRTVGAVTKIIAWVICITLMLTGIVAILDAVGVISIKNPFKHTTTVTTTPSVVPHFSVDDRYESVTAAYSYNTTKNDCVHLMPGSCAKGLLSATAYAVMTDPLVEGVDYNVVTEYDSYPTATKKGVARVAVTVWTRPSIANPKLDVILPVEDVQWYPMDDTWHFLSGTSVDSLDVMREAKRIAIQKATTDPELLARAEAQIIAKIQRDAVNWGNDFGYVVHPTVVFGLRPGDR